MRTKSGMRARSGWFVLLCGLSGAGPVQADPVTLHVFTGRGGDGATPSGPITVDRHGNLFGTTFNGGGGGPPCNGNCGTVFETSPPASGQTAWTTTTIHAFTDGKDGGLPDCPLLADRAGHVFGSTDSAAHAPGGNVFRLTPSAPPGGAWRFDNLYLFQGLQDGSIAYAGSPLVMSGRSVLGVTPNGGTSTQCMGGCGTIFRLTPPQGGGFPWVYSLAYDFPGGADSNPGGLTGPDQNGVFYAWTAGGQGAVFAMTPTKSGRLRPSLIYRFSGGTDGTYPIQILIGATGLFGAAAGGGANHHGQIFRLNPPAMQGGAWTKDDLYDFDGFESGPGSLALGKNGVLAGASFGEIDFSAGKVWTLAPPAKSGEPWIYHTLATRGLPSTNPENAVFGLHGHVYGVMNGGDTGSLGLVFEIP